MRQLLYAALIGAFCAGCTGDLDAVTDQGPGGSNNPANGAPNVATNATTNNGTDPDAGPPDPPSGNDLPQDALFVCGDLAPSTEGRIRRVNRSEWARLTGNAQGSNAGKNPFDAPAHLHYQTYSQDVTINDTILDIHLDTVKAGTYGWATRDRYRAGALASNVDEDSLACMYDDGGRPDDACIENWVRIFLERGVLFRPPSEPEVSALVGFAQTALDAEAANASTRRHTLEQVVSAAWMTSGALFRSELGEGTEDEFGRRQLTDWEYANAIAFALDGRAAGTPGAYARFGLAWSAEYEGHLSLIRQAAIDGTISDPATIELLVETYFAGVDPERRDLNLDIRDERKISRRGEYYMAEGVRDFFREWLGYMAITTIFKDSPGETSKYGDDVTNDYGNLLSGFYGHEPKLVDQMDDYIARIVAEDTDVFKNLMTSRMYYTPATAEFEGTSISASTLQTNYIYGVETLTESTREARWIELPADERAGVLTHPAWLAAHALAFENDPNLVHRGKWIREELLCGEVPDVPITVEAALDPDTRDQSARQRMTEQVDSRAECTGCHNLMNPLGYPFEIYNHAGYLRETDHGAAPNGMATLIQMPDPALDGPVTSAVDMAERFGDSPYAKRCFIRQTFRYFMGRDEVERDACTLASMEQAYDDSGGKFSALLAALFASDSFKYRVTEYPPEVDQ